MNGPGLARPARTVGTVVAKPRKVNKRKQTIYYIQTCINSLDFTNDPNSLHSYIRNSYLLKRILTIILTLCLSTHSLFLFSFACALKLRTRPLHTVIVLFSTRTGIVEYLLLAVQFIFWQSFYRFELYPG